MADGDLVETIYGKRHKFEIYKAKRAFGGASFFIHRDGSYWKGNIDSLSRAVDEARDAG